MIRLLWLFLLVPLFFLFETGKDDKPLVQTKNVSSGRDYTIERTGELDKALSEVSGWVFVNDSTLIAHNDSGNEPVLFVLNSNNGTIRKRVRILGTKNIDTEDIAFDGTNLYLGDFGNNGNARKDLSINVIPLKAVLNDTVATATSIGFHYPEQKAFPPADSLKYYDAEAMTFFDKQLWIITKCRTKPFDGIAKIYRLGTKEPKAVPRLVSELRTGKSTWMKDAVTAAANRNGILYLLTYNRLILVKGFPEKPVITKEIHVGGLSQKEAVAVNSKGEIFVTDERQPVIGGGRIYKITLRK